MADVRRKVGLSKSNGPSKGSFLNPRKVVTARQSWPSTPGNVRTVKRTIPTRREVN